MVNIRERDLAAFAEEAGLPVITDNCPACFNAPTERERIKDLLATQEHKVPQLFNSLAAAMRPLMALTDANDRGIAGEKKKPSQQPNHASHEDASHNSQKQNSTAATNGNHTEKQNGNHSTNGVKSNE